MSRLQDQVDLIQAGGILKLEPPGREFEGPVVINQPLIIEGQGGTIWSREGPVVQIRSNGVELRRLNLEVTSKDTTLDEEAACALLVHSPAKITLNVVTIRGNVLGLDTEEGDWHYPRSLQLGVLKAGVEHEFTVTLVVPVPCSLVSNIDGLHLTPKKVASAGTVDVTIKVDDSLQPGTLVRGEVELRTALLTRRIDISGNIARRDTVSGIIGGGEKIWPLTARKTTNRPSPRPTMTLPDEIAHQPQTMIADHPISHADLSVPNVVDGPPPPPAPPAPPPPPPRPAAPTRLTVAKMGDADCQTIAEALQRIQAGGRINVRPGLYRESLVIDKDVELIGDGARADIRIETDDGNCLRITAKNARIRGLSLRAAGRGSRERYAVAISQGSVHLEDCDITSDSLACVAVFGSSARPHLIGCKIHGGKSAGLLLMDSAEGVIDDCDIFDHAGAGIEIKSAANPVVRRCRIHRGRQVGVLVHDRGRGSIEECDIHDNAYAAVEIASAGNPHLRDCRIHDGTYPGIRVFDKGTGTIENCDITNNLTGIEIRQGSKPTIRQCRISRSKQSGILLFDKALGQIEDCKIFDNAFAGIEIRELSNPGILQCKIHTNGDAGISIADRASATIEDCEVSKNAGHGISVRDKAKPMVRRCQIHGNTKAGLLAAESGTGTFETCQIHSNAWAGVVILTEANPTLKRCEIRDGGHAGVVVMDEGTGILEKCTITGNDRTGVVVARKGNPQLLECKIRKNKQGGVWAFQQAAGTLGKCDVSGNEGEQLDIASDCQVRNDSV